jgi:predicted acyl esterase
VARRLTTTVTNLAPEHRTCRLDADLYVPAGELSHRVISPSRVADITTPVTIELPAIVHQFPAGHRLVVVLAGGDVAYRGSTLPQPVALVTGPGRDQQLTVAVVNRKDAIRRPRRCPRSRGPNRRSPWSSLRA